MMVAKLYSPLGIAPTMVMVDRTGIWMMAMMVTAMKMRRICNKVIAIPNPCYNNYYPMIHFSSYIPPPHLPPLLPNKRMKMVTMTMTMVMMTLIVVFFDLLGLMRCLQQRSSNWRSSNITVKVKHREGSDCRTTNYRSWSMEQKKRHENIWQRLQLQLGWVVFGLPWVF